MKVYRNQFNRFDIHAIPDKGVQKQGKVIKLGINGYHGRFENIIGWFLHLRIFRKTVGIEIGNGKYYFHCKSVENWLKRVDPEQYATDLHLRKNSHNPIWVKQTLTSLSQTLEAQKKRKELEIVKDKNVEAIQVEPQELIKDKETSTEENPESTVILQRPEEKLRLPNLPMSTYAEYIESVPQIQTDNSELDSVRQAFIQSFQQSESALGLQELIQSGSHPSERDLVRPEVRHVNKEEFKELITKIRELSQKFPSRKMKIYCKTFCRGIAVFYGEQPGEKKLVSINHQDGPILLDQAKNHLNDFFWPIIDPESHGYFIPEITEIEEDYTNKERPFRAYIKQLIDDAEADKDSTEYRILEALVPYAKIIQSRCGLDTYQRVRNLIKTYPESDEQLGDCITC